MTRKAEPSFELQKIIWAAAAKVGKDKPTAIQRQLDYELEKRRTEKGDIFEDTPDVRTISKIVKQINKLNPELVRSELPEYVWVLRDDYQSIKEAAKGSSQALQKEEILTDKKAESVEVIPNEIEARIQRILTRRPAYEWPFDGEFKIKLLGTDEYITLPQKQGNFRVYMVRSTGWPPYTNIVDEGFVADFEELWYIAKHEGDIGLETVMSDISVLMHRCSYCVVKVTFIIATDEDLVSERGTIYSQFEKLKGVVQKEEDEFFNSSFSLEIWDRQGLLEKEKQLGLKLDL